MALTKSILLSIKPEHAANILNGVKTLEQLGFIKNDEKVTKEFTAAEYVKKLNDNIYTIVLFSDGDVLAEKEERGTGFPMEVNQELYKAITFEMKKRGWWK